MSLTEKVAYIKGVIEGMDFDKNTNEGKIIDLIIDLLDDVTKDVTDVYESTQTLNAYIEEIDEDLGVLEEVVYEAYEDECECECDDDCDCDDCCCDDEYDFDDCDDDGEYDFFKVICPSCNEEVYLDNSIDPSRVFCPACHNEFSAESNN